MSVLLTVVYLECYFGHFDKLNEHYFWHFDSLVQYFEKCDSVLASQNAKKIALNEYFGPQLKIAY